MPTTAKNGPERFGKYLLLERLGTGGMAEAFKAVAEGVRGFRRIVVVKRILPHLASNEGLAEMFSHEARICALLSHPNIVHVQDFGEAEGTLYIAMEHLNGEPLSWALERLGRANERLPFTVIASIIHQVASGLDYAHRLRSPSGEPLGIVHRDVKPANVMLLYNGTVKILDFGIARAANMSDTPATAVGMIKGSLGYQTPEQLLGSPADPRSDVFSLGVIMWEMLTNRRLFFAATEAMTYRKILEEPVVPPSVRRTDVPMALESITMRALERSADHRYQTAGAMAADIEQWLDAQPVDSQEMSRILRALQDERYEKTRGSLRKPPRTLWVGPSAATDHTDPALLVPQGLADTPVPEEPTDTAASVDAILRLPWWRRPAVLFGGGACGAAVLAAVLIIGIGRSKPPATRNMAAAQADGSAVARVAPRERQPVEAPRTTAADPPAIAAPAPLAAQASEPPRRPKSSRSPSEARARRRAAPPVAAVGREAPAGARRPAPADESGAAVSHTPAARPPPPAKILNAEPEDPFK